VDVRIAQAREHHAAAADLDDQAHRRRYLRDIIIRQLRQEDPKRWTFGRLAREVGVSKQLIAYVCGCALEPDEREDFG